MIKTRLKVLVMDKDKKFLEIAEEKLSERGFKVIKTSTAADTIEILKAICIDSIMILNKDEERIIHDFVKTLKKQPTFLDLALPALDSYQSLN
ncbi:hypothetical protein SHI21_19315 [Bacteriovorax sp. PP10]|uniref:Response regulatory domain-containing protein n=1 Tax=Bacteriovorax antarcticus TaxID=3088717 RepID=A0ABU5W1J2_9BACT|nr:hypothetical protein [Bacteriovorax sp. PP10]MEA9358394.1 hypothetical protein [Bacteriovorax sp. PP10]